MPFTPHDELQPSPLVRIFFSGQLIIEPQTDRTCEVFINHSAVEHSLSVEIRMKRPGEPDAILMRQFGSLEFAAPRPPSSDPIHGLLIQASSPTGVKAYNEGRPNNQRATRLSTAVDLRVLHPVVSRPTPPDAVVTVDQRSGRPSIFIDDGIFYGAEQTPADLNLELRRLGSPARPLPRVAAIIGANIYGEALVRWRLNGKLKSLPLEQLAPGYSYEIYISNDPPYEEPSLVVHDELKEYYKILNVPTQDQYELGPPRHDPPEVLAKRDKKGSIRIPCMPVINGV